MLFDLSTYLRIKCPPKKGGKKRKKERRKTTTTTNTETLECTLRKWGICPHLVRAISEGINYK
jgi:hypothetical protein